MPISFNGVSPNLRAPAVVAEFDNSRSSKGPALMPFRGLLIGQMTSGGSGAANALYPVSTPDDVAKFAGQGSMLHRMSMAWFNKYGRAIETYIGTLADDSGGTAATKTVTFTGPASAAGVVSLYIGGSLVRTAVSKNDSATNIAAAVRDDVNANDDLPVTATASSGALTLAFRHKGAVGEDLDVRLNYQDGEALPDGVGATVAAGATGATNPVLTSLITAMGDRWFHIIAHPYTDSTSLTALENELASRAGPSRSIDGVAFTAKQATHATLVTLGTSRNSPHSEILSCDSSPTPNFEYAAEVASAVAFYGNEDPAAPFQSIPLTWSKPGAESAQFTYEERDSLLHNGISTTKVGPGGVVELERMITTYQLSAGGSPDTSYLDVTTLLTLMYVRYSIKNRIKTRYGRHKLAADGTRFGAGQRVVTPLLLKAECLAWFRELESAGLLEDFDQFKADLVVERNESDPSRVDILLPPNLVNGFIVGAISVQFRL